jgi:RND family efflux transporter MFP subunit
MRYTEPGKPALETHSDTLEDSLRQENQELKRQIQELKGSSHHGGPAKVWRPSGVTIAAILIGAAIVLAIAFLAGYLPRQKRLAQIVSEAHEQGQALPRVEVVEVGRSGLSSGLQLPGNIQAITEAPILARADGYLARRFVDIGDRVKSGQPLAEIEAPELDAQVLQAKANVQQTQAAMEQAAASLEQGKTDLELARVTSERWTRLASQGVVSRQDNDQYQAQYRSKVSNVQALEKAILVQRSNIAAAEANVSRLEKLLSYRTVRAPFDGVVTLRNVDAGALVNAGSTLMFRIAQTRTLRAYVNIPQTHASSVRPGQSALLTVSNLPGRQFKGAVVRSASALDPTSRTMLVEVEVPNPANALLPGMYAEVDLSSAHKIVPAVIPSDALIIRADGTQVAVVGPDNTVHLQKIDVGRDYGDRLEVSSGLEHGQRIIVNPGDAAQEGLKVEVVPHSRK